RRCAREDRSWREHRAGLYRVHLSRAAAHRGSAQGAASMNIGVPRETKEGERRVALLPREVRALTQAGHRVHVESGAGRGVHIDDDAYREAGASVGTAADAWSGDLV